MMIPEEISLIVSSDTANGAINKSADGSTFEIQLQTPIDIPKEAKNVNITVEEATVWWTIPNIVSGENDLMRINGPNTSDVLTQFDITIPQGLYDISGLNAEINRLLETAGAKVSPNPLISLSANTSTQKVQIRYGYATVAIDFTIPQTPRLILGYDSSVYFVGSAPITVSAPNVAQFNQVNYFLIHSDLVNQGLRFNNTYNQTIAQVLITVPPGSQIVSTPFNPPKSNAQELAGTKRRNLRFYLTDDRNRPVNTNTENWTARIVIHYLIPS